MSRPQTRQTAWQQPGAFHACWCASREGGHAPRRPPPAVRFPLRAGSRPRLGPTRRSTWCTGKHVTRTSAAAHAWRQSPEHRREAAPEEVGAVAAGGRAAKCGAAATCWNARHSVHAAAAAASRDSVTAAAQLPASGADAEVHANLSSFCAMRCLAPGAQRRSKAPTGAAQWLPRRFCQLVTWRASSSRNSPPSSPHWACQAPM